MNDVSDLRNIKNGCDMEFNTKKYTDERYQKVEMDGFKVTLYDLMQEGQIDSILREVSQNVFNYFRLRIKVSQDVMFDQRIYDANK